jgi:hypothetical protein
MSKEKQDRRNRLDPGYAQGVAYNHSPIPGSPENIGGLQINMTGNPGNRADALSQPSLDGTVKGMYEDREEPASKVPAMGSVVKDHPRSDRQQGYQSVSTRGLNKTSILDTAVTPDEKAFAYLEANRLNGAGAVVPTQLPEFMSAMGQVGVQAPMPGSSDPQATPAQNSLGFTFDPSASIAPGSTKSTKIKPKRGNA